MVGPLPETSERGVGTVQPAVPNAMSIDLEDWFCVSNLSHVIKPDDWVHCELRIAEGTSRILHLLEKHNTEATFFVLGWIAERLPNLVREIAERGHEIASHGYSHRPLTTMTPAEFEEDLQRALEVTCPCACEDIMGFRAPSFSITQGTRWAVDVLTNNGFRYDSSIYPIGFHPDYGIPTAPLSIHRLNGSMLEVPLSCAELFGRRIPCSGGGYFRMYPYRLTRYLLKRCNRQGRPVVFYLHPWEVDPHQPRMHGLSPLKRFRHYHNLHKTLDRFASLLHDFSFTSIRKLLRIGGGLPS
jgi:polysaccharide deacetylase family protein (PEP-CTERM system associated)